MRRCVVRIQDIMVRDVATCRPESTLEEAARLMTEFDCGFLPVLDAADETLRGVLTDRDICMAAYRKKAILDQILVADAMSSDVHTCRPDTDVVAIHGTMRDWRVRRVPVVDDERHVVGVVSVDDLAFRATHTFGPAGEAMKNEVAKTLGAVTRPPKS